MNVNRKSFKTHRVEDIPMVVGGGQMQGRVVPQVGGGHAAPPPQKGLHYAPLPLLAGPVQQREPVVVPGGEE